MKRILLSLALIVGTAAAMIADTYNYLTLTSTSMERSIALKSVKRITFENEKLVVTTADGGKFSMPLATFTKFAFTEEETAIRSVGSSRGNLRLENGKIVGDGKGILLLFNANGQLVRQQSATGTANELSLTGLPSGLYIARLGNQTLKVIHQ